jgi:Protein of unknown function (DUF4239)
MLVSLENWLISLPTAAAIGAIAGALVGLSCLGLTISHFVLPHGVRRSHNDVAGFTISVVGVMYAVLLAFLAIAVWEDFRRADALVQTEANLVSDLYRDTVGLPASEATELRHYLFVYAEVVVQDEWPPMALGQLDDAAGWQVLDEFHLALANLPHGDETQTLLVANMGQLLNLLYDARRGRFHAAAAELQPILWWNLLVGALLTILFSYLFGVPDFRMHLAMVAMLSAVIGLVLALILVLAHPFQGPNHVSVEPFETLVKAVERKAYPHRDDAPNQ